MDTNDNEKLPLAVEYRHNFKEFAWRKEMPIFIEETFSVVLASQLLCLIDFFVIVGATMKIAAFTASLFCHIV
jgi:hypothetical protein